MYSLLADLVLALHVSYVLFVVVGQLLILIGWIRRWGWVRNPWFRLIHFAAIGAVVLQSWLGVICPLTILENELRLRAGMAGYEEYNFIGYWMSRFIFFEAPSWMFVVVYTVFGLLVVAALVVYLPRMRKTGD